ncbi:S9 family peptidase [Rhizobium rhizophilum]|uniref:prolyl oligopeptidase n=2 Tax=Rhizobium rhizophilum TaxID=1850373 RepID=A0ABY2QS23_9HYPH|nr:S9 family peptidase [Rhizobium rhizophilum]
MCLAAAIVCLLLGAEHVRSNEETPMTYPETKKVDLTEEHFGTAIADPYRWLENDLKEDRAVAQWVDAQNTVTSRYTASLPGRDAFRDRLTALFNHEQLTSPLKRGGDYFFTRNTGLDMQPVLVVRDGENGAERTILDPNQWSEDGTKALAVWAPSEDGKLVAYAIQENGSDWRPIRVLDVQSGAVLADEIAWARFTMIAWMADGSGFFYARSPEPDDSGRSDAQVVNHAVYFHRLGTEQSEDRLIHSPAAEHPLLHTVDITADGRFLVIYSTALMGGSALSVVDLSASEWQVRPVIERFDHLSTLVGNVGTKLYVLTADGAEQGKIVTGDLAAQDLVFTDLIEEKPGAYLRLASLVGDKLLLSYMVDARIEVERYELDGKAAGAVNLPEAGSAGTFSGRPGDNEAFFTFTNYATPKTVYRYDVNANEATLWAGPDGLIGADSSPGDIEVEQSFFSARDGTLIPISIIRRAAAKAAAPTMLTAYGGFGIPLLPAYSPQAVAWVQEGGVYAVANIRGGGEYGKAWHEAGKGQAKKTVFDDFIAAAEFLKHEGISSEGGLAIHGESHGGMLVGAVVNQRPDLFDVALPGVGVMDMLRFDRFTAGNLWISEFGSPSAEDSFNYLRSYSPLHNIKTGEDYPAILVTTADTDDRVVPAHSLKYVATLQAAQVGPRPQLLRVERNAGHGDGTPNQKIIDEYADRWSFAAHWTGLW